MKPFEDCDKNNVKISTSEPDSSRVKVTKENDEVALKVNSTNNSNTVLDVNPIKTISPTPTPSSSTKSTIDTIENTKSNVTFSKSNNGEGKDNPMEASNVNDSETRGRKMTSVNFLPCDCKLCGEKFNSDKALGYHIRDVHVVGKKDKKDGEANCKKKPKDYHYVRGKDWKVLNPKRPYCCSICSKRFLYESSLNHHKVVKHNEKIDGGGEDGNITSSTGGNNNIPPKIYNHTFQCDQCGKILMSKHSLIRHLVSFHGTDHEKPFQCDICGQRYVSISSLVSHRRKEHTGDKPYVCEHCGKAFTMSNRLKCHLRVHSDEKFYKCQQCSKQFKSCSAFRAHKDTHLGVMRHTCKYCERKFLFQGNMIKHIRRRHPNGDKLISGSSGLINNSSIQTNVDNIVFTSESNLPVSNGQTTVNNGSSLSESGSHAIHPSGITVTSTMTINSIPNNNNHNLTTSSSNITNSTSRRSNNNHRYLKTIQTPDHSYFSKEMTVNVHSNMEQQQQNMQSLSPLEQFVQPEIQFQVLPLPSLPNQEIFNGINTYQSTNLNQTNSVTTTGTGVNSNSGLNHQGQSMANQRKDSRIDFSSLPTSGKCRLCDQSFSDVRFHITDFHRIPIQKVESMMPTMIYF